MKTRLMTSMLIATVLASSLPLLAHHGNASYDVTKKPTIKGVVTEFIWANPHCYLRFDAKDENGNVVHWLVEASNPPDQTREGWTKNTFKPGDEVEITMASVARNGQPIGRFGDRIVINGKVLKAPQTAPPTAP